MRDAIWPQPLLDTIVARGTEPLFELGDRIVSGDEMTAMIRRVAAGLRAGGVGPGDGVVLHLGVSPEAFAVIVAAFAVGARVTGVRADQLEHVLSTSGGRLIDESSLTGLLTSPDDGLPLTAAGRPAAVAWILYTSGSTGQPKGCCRTYAAISQGWNAYPDRWPPAIREIASGLGRFLVFGSLSSAVMLEYSVLALTAGGVLVAADPPIYPEALSRLQATAGVITVGRLHQLVRAQRERPEDLSRLRALMVSGSPLEPRRLAEALEVLGPVIFHEYGQTETGPIAMITPAELTARPDLLSSVGQPPPGVAVEVRGGELFVRTPAQAQFYWDDPAESAEVFVDGWVRTRDLAEIRLDGYLRLSGRARDVIIVQAELVYAGPIERALASHRAVAEAYVIGRPDEDSGEAVHAFVVPEPGQVPPVEELRALVRDRLGPKAVPQTVTFVDAVPLTPNGKPDKKALDPYRATPSSRTGHGTAR
ncbi:class I adenylate-forming enzyme family protein [Paractinoplanes toevensis]|uniref:AMP-dependent synthetase n=1 Tax=Paractinoplanes toevensis TaxID=571911 RepID=A0A919TCY4_9ACTN|nr:fatty acid--CoA ligase family protein [Actinoplanes toevensis]GIM93022.1 AMP-dependent synthetase [Actinoplanes toevensis]